MHLQLHRQLLTIVNRDRGAGVGAAVEGEENPTVERNHRLEPRVTGGELGLAGLGWVAFVAPQDTVLDVVEAVNLWVETWPLSKKCK